jgi:hypothetical protein
VNFPAARASKYFWWLRRAHRSCSSRSTPCCRDTSPTLTARGRLRMGLRIMSGSSSMIPPSRVPQRTPRATRGAWLMASIPPAMAVWISPARILRMAKPAQVMEEQQARSIVREGVVGGKPPVKRTWRAATDAVPARTATPRKSSSTISGWSGVFSKTPLTAWVARSTAGKSLSSPPNFPKGILPAPTMTASFMSSLPLPLGGLANQTRKEKN